MTRRLFVAVWLPGEARAEAAGVLDRLAVAAPDVRWAPPESLHVTLAFLGDVDEPRIPALEECIGRALAGAPAFELALGPAGRFPAQGPARVVWLGLEVGRKEIAALASRLERRLVPAGFLAPSDRPFRAHVTLGRPKGARGFGRPADLLDGVRPCGGAVRVEEVTLAESRLTPRGSQYEAMARFPLTGIARSASSPREGDRA